MEHKEEPRSYWEIAKSSFSSFPYGFIVGVTTSLSIFYGSVLVHVYIATVPLFMNGEMNVIIQDTANWKYAVAMVYHAVLAYATHRYHKQQKEDER